MDRSPLARALRWGLGACLLSLASCLAPAPPIVVHTPYGKVHAESQASAEGVAEMLMALAPQVQEMLPGAQERAIDVWVQKKLQVYLHQERPESVRGFTLLSEAFEARRIHLQKDEQSPWYLSHELVHALVDESWRPLPGILEEGVADVIAARLNPLQSTHIRAHRLLNASAFTDGLLVDLLFLEKHPLTLRTDQHRMRSMVLRFGKSVPKDVALSLLNTPREDLHSNWSALPESFYGFAWLLVDRIGVERLHELCLAATSQGLAIIPSTWILAAANLSLEQLTPEFLSTCFTQKEFKHAIFLRPRAFASAVLGILSPLHDSLQPELYFPRARPAFKLADGSEIPLSTTGPMMEELMLLWPPKADD